MWKSLSGPPYRPMVCTRTATLWEQPWPDPALPGKLPVNRNRGFEFIFTLKLTLGSCRVNDLSHKVTGVVLKCLAQGINQSKCSVVVKTAWGVILRLLGR